MRVGLRRMLRLFCSKKGNEMVEAGIVLPVIILLVVLFLRIFAFYIEILSVQVNSHAAAVSAWDSFEKPYISMYKDSRELKLLAGGILSGNLNKEIKTEAYLINEDILVRTGEVLND